MGVVRLPAFIAGSLVEPEDTSPRVRSLDGTLELPAAETSSVQLRRALRFADTSQAHLLTVPLAERLEAARLVVRAYAARADDVCFALAHTRGLTANDARWMVRVNLEWVEALEQLVEIMSGGFTREVSDGQARLGTLLWRSKGKAGMFSSSTMDGPAAVVALCHAIIAGTHLILKPSFRDAATHLAFEILHEHGLDHYAQLVRWRGEAEAAPLLNRQLLSNVAQGVVFSANETYQELLDGAAPPGSPEWRALEGRTKRYGTGLPLGIVTARADLGRSARDLVEGARLGGGRFCLSAGPVLVERGCHDAVVEEAVRCARALRSGPPLSETTQLSSHDSETAEAMRSAVRTFGGSRAYGEIRPSDMDVMVLSNVPSNSSALHRELPGPVLAFVPVDDLAEAASIATAALRRNQREAWTAVVTFGDREDHLSVTNSIDSYRYLHGGVVAQVKLLLPHQGSYFALDLMRRVSLE